MISDPASMESDNWTELPHGVTRIGPDRSAAGNRYPDHALTLIDDADFKSK
jgi:hypothetical protein